MSANSATRTIVPMRWQHPFYAATAAFVGASSIPVARCLRKTNGVNPNGLSDPDWYEEQHQHIALGLPLIEEAKQGWWHEVTRRLRQNSEDANSSDTSNGCTLLHLASAAGRRRLVEELLDFGAQASPRDLMGRTPLHHCAEHGSESVAMTLANGGANVNEQDNTGASALSIAARLGHVRLVRWLCTRPELQPCSPDRYGATALHKAVSFGQFACVEALCADRRVRACIDQPVYAPTVPDSYQALTGGESALHLACLHTYTFHHQMHTKIARVLLATGADPNVTTAAGQNACHCAAAAGNTAIVRELSKCGRVRPESWTARDEAGRTPVELARPHGSAMLSALPPAAHRTHERPAAASRGEGEGAALEEERTAS